MTHSPYDDVALGPQLPAQDLECMPEVMMVYCDESRQNGHSYKLIGGIWGSTSVCKKFSDRFYEFCDKTVSTRPGHMKWTKVPPSASSRYMRFYTGIVDLFFEYAYSSQMMFRTIIAGPKYDMTHPVYHMGDPEKGFYTLYYELIVHTLRASERYHIRVGHRDVSRKESNKSEMDRLSDLHQCLNRGFSRIAAQWGGNPGDVVLSVESRRAQDCLLIQLADILLGATGFHWNDEHLNENAREGKKYLAAYISQELGRSSLKFESPLSERVFNIFLIKPRRT